jgi:UDP-N-acetylglucosamine 2-epimerase
VGIRECSFLGVPVVNVGTRQRGRQRAGNVVNVRHEGPAIAKAIRQVTAAKYAPSTLYGDGRSGERIASILSGEAKEAAA